MNSLKYTKFDNSCSYGVFWPRFLSCCSSDNSSDDWKRSLLFKDHLTNATRYDFNCLFLFWDTDMAVIYIVYTDNKLPHMITEGITLMACARRAGSLSKQYTL